MTYNIRLDDLIDTVRGLHPGGGPLDHLSDAIVVSERLGETADHLIGHFVDQARRSGATWAEIGAAMGVSKQAAQKRFVPANITSPEFTAADFTARGPFSRFTDRARLCIVAAQEAARATRSPVIGTEHLLLGLFDQPDGLAAQALRAAGVTDEALRGAVAAVSAPGSDEPSGHIPFDTSAKKAIELTVREALRLGHNYVGTEHILLGLLADPDTVAARLLSGLGVTRDGTEQFVTDRLAGFVADRDQ
ncbi:Clp protease N-terminal domain-containing protein [Tsukamurella soli]|uniref:Clp protease N-terminal domain-containing protein n=1 Tax=Tsukamurella soli TaxID=644556 RepID=A0ABP8JWP5_9ACTN